MPYIVTTYTPGPVDCGVSRTAVATLDEARELAYDRIVHTPEYTRVTGFPTLEWTHRQLPESGGTIGPFPDGTVIEVRRVMEHELRAAIPACNTFPVELHVDGRDLIAAFNEANR